MEYLIGVGLAVGVCAFGRLSGFDRGRVFYSTMVIVVASYYILFAVMGGSPSAVTLESMLAAFFCVVAALGFKRSEWLIVAGLTGHGVLDFYHHLLVQNPGVPLWWPGFCGAFDVIAGGFLAVLLMRRSSLPSQLRCEASQGSA